MKKYKYLIIFKTEQGVGKCYINLRRKIFNKNDLDVIAEAFNKRNNVKLSFVTDYKFLYITHSKT